MAADDIHLEARVKCFSWLVAHACTMHSGIPRPLALKPLCGLERAAVAVIPEFR